MKYLAVNYSMGRAVSSTTLQANGHEEAMRKAERLLPGQHAQGEGGRKARVIGVRAVK